MLQSTHPLKPVVNAEALRRGRRRKPNGSKRLAGRGRARRDSVQPALRRGVNAKATGGARAPRTRRWRRHWLHPHTDQAVAPSRGTSSRGAPLPVAAIAAHVASHALVAPCRCHASETEKRRPAGIFALCLYLDLAALQDCDLASAAPATAPIWSRDPIQINRYPAAIGERGEGPLNGGSFRRHRQQRSFPKSGAVRAVGKKIMVLWVFVIYLCHFQHFFMRIFAM